MNTLKTRENCVENKDKLDWFPRNLHEEIRVRLKLKLEYL